jgi:hypothetical protein
MVSASESSVGVLLEALPATKLVYFDDMWQLQAHGRVLTVVEVFIYLSVPISANPRGSVFFRRERERERVKTREIGVLG